MSGPKLATMAWRNLWRQKRRTILTLISISFGGFMAVMMSGMNEQNFSDFIDTAARMGSGHVVVLHDEYLDTPSLSRSVTASDELRKSIKNIPHVDRIVDRIVGQAMISTAHDSFGAGFIAYDPNLEGEDSFNFLEGVVEGKMYETADDKGIILGKVLAKNLKAELGDKVVYTMMDKNGEIVAGMGRLIGTIGTGATSADASLFLLPLNKARQTLGYSQNESTHVGIYLEDNRRSPQVAAALKSFVPNGTEALTWAEIAPDLNAFVAMKIGGGRFFMIVIGLLVTAGIFNTMFMSVMERVREFGILLALGYTSRQVFQLVMWESIWLSLVGLLLSGIITYYPYTRLAETGIDMTAAVAGERTMEIGGIGLDMVINFGMYPETLVAIVASILVATISAGIYPAWKAGRVEPVESIRLV